MNDFSHLGKVLISLGVVIIVFGAVLALVGKVPWLGRLPGDISIKRDRFAIYFPLGTSILLSIILSLIMYFLNRK